MIVSPDLSLFCTKKRHGVIRLGTQPLRGLKAYVPCILKWVLLIQKNPLFTDLNALVVCEFFELNNIQI